MMQKQATVTVRQVAAKCKVSKTTAALALKNSPLVSIATRKAVRREATRMGYKIDARVTKLMKYLSQRKQHRGLCNIGWLNCWPRENEWRQTSWQIGFLQGAKSRAEELGYVIDEIWLQDPQMRIERLPALLRARGIEGILIPPLIAEVPALRKNLVWKDLHTVLINEPFDLPRLNRVDSDFNFNLQLALREIIRLGYKRPGLLIDPYHDWRSNHSFSGQFSIRHGDALPREYIAPFWTSLALTPDEFNEWYLEKKPDVLFVTSNEWVEFLMAAGLRVPEDVGLVHLNWGYDVQDWAGVDPRRELLGSSAVDLLVSHLSRDEKGIPPYVKLMQIQGVWVPGTTVRKQGSSSGPSAHTKQNPAKPAKTTRVRKELK